MQRTYSAVVKKSGDWWLGWIEEAPGVNCQEATREELLESLRLTLREALEWNRRDAFEAAGDGYDEEPIAAWSLGLCRVRPHSPQSRDCGAAGLPARAAVSGCWGKSSIPSAKARRMNGFPSVSIRSSSARV